QSRARRGREGEGSTFSYRGSWLVLRASGSSLASYRLRSIMLKATSHEKLTSRRFHLVQQRFEYCVGRLSFDLEFGGERDAVTQRREGESLDVVGGDKVASIDKCMRPGGTDQSDAAAGACAGCDPWPRSCGASDPDGIIGHTSVHRE